MNIAIIPARGGSKRVPGKNTKLFAGIPLIAYSILAAKATRLFSHVIVSTDSDDIAAVALEYGAEVPFRRSPELANDEAGIDAVLVDGIQATERLFGPVEFACCIYATAPLLVPDFLREGLTILKSSGASCATGVTTFTYPIFRALRTDGRGRLNLVWPEYAASRSQDLPHVVHEAGQFHWVDAQKFKAIPDTFHDVVPVLLPRWTVQDIDTLEDWEVAEKMFVAHGNKPGGANS